MLIFGAHVSIAKGFGFVGKVAIEKYKSNAVQIFTKNPRGRGVKPFDEKDLNDYLEYKKKLKYVLAHSSYLLNFGRKIDEIKWAEKDLITDFERMKILKGDAVVVHIGKTMGKSEEETLENIIENAKIVIEKVNRTGVKYLLENTAGQGTELGYSLEHFSKISNKLSEVGDKFGFCFDTAHLWAAGFDLSNPASVQKTLKEITDSVGIKKIDCFHFNDSKKELGSKVDRHDNLGKGLIPMEGLKEVAKFAVKNSIPIILETPDKNENDRINDIKILKSFID